MLGWMTGQKGDAAGSTDDSKLPEPPETPAPVFAIRAFKSALFGTPSGESEDGERTVRAKRHTNHLQRRQSTIPQLAEGQTNVKETKKDDQEAPPQPLASPTKSILVTPGTTSNRRKTVSFGDTVHHDEQKKDRVISKTSNTTLSLPSGSVTSQWIYGQSDGKTKARSKFTQSLLDSRGEPMKELPRHVEPVKKDRPPAAETKEIAMVPRIDEKNDETINLNEPRSQSGQYWKAEFESYRKRTNLETRKLIQLRSAAKSYARKKDAEALRLAEKLRQEEAKVADMERHVTNLASNMVGGAQDADKEQLVQELTKQTALAVQYKHKVDTLRKALERHGVVGTNYDQPEAETSVEATEELRKAQHALEQANAEIEEMKQQGDIKKLQELVQSSERKTSELEKENSDLKQTLARVKQEMRKYEGRRKEKEAKLKQREAKLESRNQEYREKLKERRESEDALKRNFEEERNTYLKQIQALGTKIATMERSVKPGHFEEAAYSPRKDYTGVQIQDFGAQHERNLHHTGDLLQLWSPGSNPRRQHIYYSQPTAKNFQDSRRHVGGGEQAAEPLIWFEDSQKHSHRRTHTVTNDGTAAIPSPPALTGTVETPHLKHPSRPYMSPRPTMITFPTHQRERESDSRPTQHRMRQRHPPKDSTGTYATQQQQLVAATPGNVLGSDIPSLQSRGSTVGAKRESLSPDRIAAAKARLKQKEENRRVKKDGKENIREVLN